MKKRLNDLKRALLTLWQLDRTLFIVDIGMGLSGSIIPYIEIYLSAYILDHLAEGLVIEEFMKHVSLFLLAIFALQLLNHYLDKVQTVHTGACHEKFEMLMGARTLEMDFELLESPKVNEIRKRISLDNSWGAGFSSIIWQFPMMISNIMNLLLAVIILIPLFTESQIFQDSSAILLLLGMTVVTIAYALFEKWQEEKLDRLMEESSKVEVRYDIWGDQDYQTGKDIRLFKGQKVIEKYLDQDSKGGSFVQSTTKNLCQSGMVNGLSTGLMQTMAYLFVVFRAAAGALSVGSVVKYANVIYRFTRAISGISSAFSSFAVSARRQQSTLDYINVPDVLPKSHIPVEKRAFCVDSDYDYEIEFENVSFRYPGSENWSLRNVSMKFRVGERLAIVGMNGSGKTTLIKLLCRLYDPTEGRILLNDVDIRKYEYQEYLSLFSVVFQDFKLFAFNLGQNVAASAEYDKKRVEECLKKAGFAERYETLPDKTETYLYKGFDEQGVEISGGEAQKIALARALYKNAPFVILDEPTAALDPIAEYDIYKRFNELIEQKTAIYISHRLSSCRFCDDIAVFHEGRLIQRGNHDTLLADKGNKYYEMWNAQAQYYE